LRNFKSVSARRGKEGDCTARAEIRQGYQPKAQVRGPPQKMPVGNVVSQNLQRKKKKCGGEETGGKNKQYGTAMQSSAGKATWPMGWEKNDGTSVLEFKKKQNGKGNRPPDRAPQRGAEGGTINPPKTDFAGEKGGEGKSRARPNGNAPQRRGTRYRGTHQE